MINQLQRLLVVTSVFSVVYMPAAGADVSGVGPASQPVNLAQIEATVVQITDVRFEETETGVQIILETADGSSVAAETTVMGNDLTAEIQNAQLALPGGDQLLEFEPTGTIDRVQVLSLADNQVQVVVTGTNAVPDVIVNSNAAGLTLSVVPGEVQISDSDEDTLRLLVTDEQEGYNPSSATTGTRIDTPLRDIPQSVQVVPREVLEDQAATRLGDALRNVSGIGLVRDFGGSNFGFSARGFEDVTILRNGIRSGEEDQSTLTSISTVERVEVLKGPASILFGQAEPGGLVNIITKQPEKEASYNLRFRAGSFDLIEPSLDFTGPLTSDGKLTYRLNAFYQNDGLFRDTIDADLFSISPVLRYDFSDNTNLTLEYEYAQDNRTFDDGLVLFEGFDPLSVSGDVFLGEPDNFFNDDFHRFFATLRHRFNDNLRLRSVVGGEFEDSEVNAFRVFPFQEFDPETGDVPERFFQTSEFFNRNLSWQTELIADFETGPVEHQLLAGFDFTFSDFGIDPGINVTSGPFPINVFDPVFDEEFPPDDALFNISFETDNDVNSYGLFLQDLVTLLPNLKLLLGGRLDFVSNESSFGGTFNGNPIGSESELDDEAFSPRVGIVYQPVEPVSLYGSFSRSFVPNSVTTFEGDIIEPERGTQFEVGARAEVGDVSINLALYDITKTNISVTDPNNPGFSLPIGEANSRGIELDVAGEILDGWNIIASGFLNDAEVTDGDSVFPDGDRLRVAPENGASLWTTYEIQKGKLKGLGFGAGVFFTGEAEAELPNDFVIPASTRVDASLFYKQDSWEAQLNFQNLLDSNFQELSDNTGIFGGAPFSVIGSISFKF